MQTRTKIIDFEDFDNILNNYPKNINNLIYDFYSNHCKECGTNQRYCIDCQKYQCFCIKSIFKCDVQECRKLLCCVLGHRVCECANCVEKYLCPRCWRIDIHAEIIEDIRLNG